MISISIHRIVPGFNNREEKAIQWIYENYRVPLTVTIKRITGDNPDIEDMVSDTFLVLMEHKAPFESLEKIAAFLNTVARNKSLNYLRRRNTVTEEEKGVAYHITSREARALEDAEASAVYHQLIHLARESLPPRCKQVFMLCYIEQLSTREIAKRLDITEKTVANLKLHSYKLLKKEIDPSSGSPLLPILVLILFSLK